MANMFLLGKQPSRDRGRDGFRGQVRTWSKKELGLICRVCLGGVEGMQSPVPHAAVPQLSLGGLRLCLLCAPLFFSPVLFPFSFFLNLILFLLEYSWFIVLCQFLLESIVAPSYTCIHSFIQTIFHYVLS